MTTLWTLQPPEVYERLRADGVLRADWGHVDEHFARAYRWMVAAMRERGVDTGGRPPVWAWLAWQPPARRRPDLRSSLGPRGQPGVRIELEVPDDAYVASLFDAWHAVLNRWYLSLDEAEAGAREDAAESAQVASWARIFDLEAGDPAWCGAVDERSIQATLAEVRLAWVRRVTPYVGR